MLIDNISLWQRGSAEVAGAKQVLVLRDLQGFKYREIAELKGVTLGTVKAQIHRARALVQEALER